MKLRTKILWISCIALLAASLLGDALILRITGKSLKSEAIIRAYQNFYEMTSELERGLIRNMDADTRSVYLEYYFKNLKDDYSICFLWVRNTEETNEIRQIYNHTALSAGELSQMDLRSYEDGDITCADYSRDNTDYVIFHMNIQEKIDVYRVVPMVDVQNNVRRLTGYILAITFGVTGITMLVLFAILRHILQPLQELNETTKRLAEGDYDQRVVVRRKDEIGQLEESFNKMAEAVETSTRSLEESERRKTLFMGNLTHELKTPMTAISGYAQTLLSTKISRENQEAALLYIYEECGRLERLSKKMMKLLELDQDESLVLQIHR